MQYSNFDSLFKVTTHGLALVTVAELESMATLAETGRPCDIR
jgi:hypothetical protein